MAEEWYYLKGDQQVGPVSREGMDEARRRGELTDATYVWREGMDQWQPAGQAEGLLAGGASAVPGPYPTAPPGPASDRPLQPPPQAGGYPVGMPPTTAARPNVPGATASLVCGIISLLCIGIVLGPVAIFMGLGALRRLREAPGQFSGGSLAKWGIGLGIAGTVLHLLGLIFIWLPRLTQSVGP